MKSDLGDRQRLLHISDAISEIESYTTGVGFQTFQNNSMMRFASIKQIEIIGEAANSITEETKSKFSGINWRQIIGMRHILVHEYFGIYNTVVWQVITDELPKLKIAIAQMIASFGEQI